MTTDRAHRAAAATTTALKRLCTPGLGLTLLTLLAALATLAVLAALAALHDHGGSVRTTLDRGETEARRFVALRALRALRALLALLAFLRRVATRPPCMTVLA